MPVFKNEDNGTWYVMARYVNWKGERKQKCKRAGLKTERVEDGIQCVNRIMQMPVGTYDVILMDIQMPKMDGYKATQEIRNLPDKDKACIPIIAMTANAFEEDKRDAIAAGMNGHIAKPIQVDKLLSILSEVIRQQEKY